MPSSRGTLRPPSKMEMTPEPDPDDEGTKISTVKVQGNDISHKLQISRVSKTDEGLYECRVTRANYGEIVEYKAQAWLKVNATARPRQPQPAPKKSSPLHLTDKKPRKPSSNLGHDNTGSDQRAASTSTSHTSSNTATHNPGSGTRLSSSDGLLVLLLLYALVREALLV
ncbi:V-set and transmembrane domain-containing protein 2A [Brachionichthys hirsutus]|uniref:V-set and transmembrane domain-containing protein 2A n=1 Tax=Brachionichthys hirsutus TaxID=412623 RepID=UPI00360468DE